MKAVTWATTYFQGVIAEMRKVVWPSWQVLAKHFVSVVAGLVIFTAFVAALDYIFIHLLDYLIK